MRARSSAETKAHSLEREAETLRAEKAELEKKAEALDKKVAALGTLHKEHDGRTQALRREKERAEKEARDAKKKNKGGVNGSVNAKQKAEEEKKKAEEEAKKKEEEEKVRFTPPYPSDPYSYSCAAGCPRGGQEGEGCRS